MNDVSNVCAASGLACAVFACAAPVADHVDLVVVSLSQTPLDGDPSSVQHPTK